MAREGCSQATMDSDGNQEACATDIRNGPVLGSFVGGKKSWEVTIVGIRQRQGGGLAQLCFLLLSFPFLTFNPFGRWERGWTGLHGLGSSVLYGLDGSVD